MAPPDHPAGTTWVWDDGSGVVLKAEEKAKEEIEQRKAEQKEEVCCFCWEKYNLSCPRLSSSDAILHPFSTRRPFDGI